ncbi:protein-tyrosine-phosphatase [Novosphingobium sp. FSY-8]|uniref:Protein-tyrosine-phosphatase n=1 Tax=Novosphingobium ovatum TaxID=1908523 RepID=A0ABW9X998_9SPHN|nr:tyrosine-protein phosphatase [Novosphingobium ovatum]NBC35110.1 protein-tyrosine-phosphatase [Novosphingobium ovatum]
MFARTHLRIFLAALVAVPVGAVTLLPVPSTFARPVAAVPHVRELPLQGGRNFRDLGGYRTSDGRKVVWGQLYRSGSMTNLTLADYAYLQHRGLRVVCDLRDTRERGAEPVHWPERGAPRVLFDDYALDSAGFMPQGPMREWTADQARARLASSYPRMLVQFNGQYRRMFGELLAGHAPLAVNCSAGKDRTGIASALILTALGVPRATVIEDYLLTNTYLRPETLMRGAATANSAWAQLAPEVMRAMMAADRSYIEAAFAVVDAHAGGAEGYLRDELGLDARALRRLRNLYTR